MKTLNRKWPLLLVLLAVGTMACKKVLPGKLHFTLDMPDEKFSVPPVPVAGEASLVTDKVRINLDSAVSANSSDLYQVSGATLNKFELDITDSTSNFDAFKSITVSVSHPDLGEQKVASIDSIPDGVKSLSLKTESTNLVDFLKKNPFSMKVNAVTDQPMADTTHMKSIMTFDIELSKK